MTLSQSSEINLTDNGKRALNAQNTANNAYNLANGAQDLANGAQKTADGKNSVYRGTDPNTVPKTGLKEGDIYFTDNTLYTWNGSAWEETVSDTTGAEIKAKVEAASQEAQKAAADLRSNIESKAKELDASVESAKTDMIAATNAVASDLSTTKSNLDAVSKDLSATKGNMQSGLDSVNKDLSTTKSNLDAVSKDLSDTKSSTQSSLDAINKDLSTAKSDLANVSDDLSKTKSNLADTGQKLETAVSDFQKKTDQLSGSLETANSKIEFNSNAISEVKHTAEEVSTTVSNIRVGGRNLLANTRTLSDVWSGDTETVDGFTVAKATQTNTDTYDPLWWGNLSLKPNTDYVLTFYAKASKETQIYSYLYDIGSDGAYKDGSTRNNLTTDYQRYVVDFHTDAIPAGRVVNCVPMRLFEQGATAWIYGAQLEEGNTATQWQPNPADTDQAISKVSQTADAIKADLTNTKGDVASVQATANSLQTQITDNKNNISSVKQTADSLTTRMSNAEGNVSSLQQTASGLTSRVGSAEGNISQLQQTASGLQSTVSNIRVGGRNLLSNTRTLSGVWSGDTETVDGFTVAKATQTSGDVYDPLYWNGLTTIKPNTDYVLTFYAKASKQTTIRSYLYDVGAVGAGSDGMTLNTLTTDYQRFTVKFHTYAFPAGRQINCLPVRLSENGVTAWIYGVQLEEGNIATDWTPNPDDTDQAISTIKQTAEEIRADLTNTQGDVASVQATAKSLTSSMADAKGNISQLQQTAGKITTTLSSGGTNLLSGTRDFSFTNWSWATNLSGGFVPVNQIDQYSDTEHVIERKIIMTADTRQGFWLQGNNTVGQTYTLSFDARSDNGKASVWQAGLEGNFLGTSPALTTDWIRYNYTVNVTQADHNWVIYFQTSEADNVYIRKLQLECGDTPTPWNPSSGDVSNIAQTASQLTIDMKDAKGNISSFQQTADKLTSRVGSAEGNISQLQQDSKGLTSRVGSAEGNISQLQQTASGLTSTISSMNVGGRNLLDGETGKEYSATGTTSYLDIANFRMLVPADQEHYVLSFDAKATTAGQQISTFFYCQDDYSKNCTVSAITSSGYNGSIAGDGRVTTALTTDYKRYWIKYTINPANKVYLNAIIARIEANSGTATVSVKNAKLETGTMPTDWTPSPESIDSSISQIKQTADGINAYVKKAEGSQILSSILSMDPDNSMLGQLVNGKVVAAINLSKEGKVQIDGSHISLNSETYIPDATIKSAMIESLEATKIKAGTLDASKIQVINLDANSITTGSFSAVLGKNLTFKTYTVSPSSPWDFNDTKSNYENWFLNGETTTDHVYNGPKDISGNKITPFMYVSSRGVGDSYVVTVWKDYDPTQYQRVWIHDHWTDWVMLPNSQNIVSVINLSPDGVTINGKNIELNGDTTIHGQLNLLPTDQREVDQNVQGFHNPWHWRDANVYAGGGGVQLQSTVISQKYSDDNTTIWGLVGGSSPAITTLAPTYLKFTLYKSWNDVNSNQFTNQLARTYIDAGRIETNDVRAGNFRLIGSKMQALDDNSLYVANSKGTNFDGHGNSVGFQVWGGIGLGQNTIYTPSNNLYVQQGNVGPGLGQSYSSATQTVIHCQNVISQSANTVSSRLSVKTAITKVDYDRALMAIQNTDMYDYRYTSDDSNQHYVSGIIDDVHDKPEYNMDPMLINQERTARIDANLLGYHHVVLQDVLKKQEEILKRLDKLEAKVNQD